MSQFDSLIFDLDGTLWDASATSAKAWHEAFARVQIDRSVTAQDIRSVSGLPFETCVSLLHPDPAAAAMDSLVQVVDELEKSTFQHEGGVLYEGVADGIKRLVERYRLFIVSNCQIWYMEAFLDGTGLRPLFEDYESHGRTRRPKSENIVAVVERNLLEAPIYIGDTASDQAAAIDARVPFMHVQYGFGTPELPCQSFESFPRLVEHFLIR